MITIIAKCRIKDNRSYDFITLASELVKESRKENGCISYELCQDLDGENIFVFVEKWQSQQDIDIHNSSKHFTTIVPKLSELQVCEAEVSLYKII